MARPSKLTEELIADLAAAIRTGMPIKLACQRVGISFESYRQWRSGAFPDSVSTDLQERFEVAVGRAEAQALYDALVVIKAASIAKIPGKWRAAACFCERRFPEDFGRHRAGRQRDVF